MQQGKFIYEFKLRRFILDWNDAKDISIRMCFNEEQPNSYNLPLASAKAWSQDGWIGDVREGGSCNFDEVRLVPHCNGTHTECVGHITKERISIADILVNSIVPSTLLTVTPVSAKRTKEKYIPELAPVDNVITFIELEKILVKSDIDFLKGIVIRTMPNNESKLTRRYQDAPPPFFTIEAMDYLVKEIGVQHLLVDVPSLDRAYDEGKLTNHHTYWEIPLGENSFSGKQPMLKTITEFIFAPDELLDGSYFLNIQIPPFQLDAAPSRPFLIPFTEL